MNCKWCRSRLMVRKDKVSDEKRLLFVTVDVCKCGYFSLYVSTTELERGKHTPSKVTLEGDYRGSSVAAIYEAVRKQFKFPKEITDKIKMWTTKAHSSFYDKNTVYARKTF